MMQHLNSFGYNKAIYILAFNNLQLRIIMSNHVEERVDLRPQLTLNYLVSLENVAVPIMSYHVLGMGCVTCHVETKNLLLIVRSHWGAVRKIVNSMDPIIYNWLSDPIIYNGMLTHRPDSLGENESSLLWSK